MDSWEAPCCWISFKFSGSSLLPVLAFCLYSTHNVLRHHPGTIQLGKAFTSCIGGLMPQEKSRLMLPKRERVLYTTSVSSGSSAPPPPRSPRAAAGPSDVGSSDSTDSDDGSLIGAVQSDDGMQDSVVASAGHVAGRRSACAVGPSRLAVLPTPTRIPSGVALLSSAPDCPIDAGSESPIEPNYESPRDVLCLPSCAELRGPVLGTTPQMDSIGAPDFLPGSDQRIRYDMPGWGLAWSPVQVSSTRLGDAIAALDGSCLEPVMAVEGSAHEGRALSCDSAIPPELADMYRAMEGIYKSLGNHCGRDLALQIADSAAVLAGAVPPGSLCSPPSSPPPPPLPSMPADPWLSWYSEPYLPGPSAGSYPIPADEICLDTPRRYARMWGNCESYSLRSPTDTAKAGSFFSLPPSPTTPSSSCFAQPEAGILPLPLATSRASFSSAAVDGEGPGMACRRPGATLWTASTRAPVVIPLAPFSPAATGAVAPGADRTWRPPGWDVWGE